MTARYYSAILAPRDGRAVRRLVYAAETGALARDHIEKVAADENLAIVLRSPITRTEFERRSADPCCDDCGWQGETVEPDSAGAYHCRDHAAASEVSS